MDRKCNKCGFVGDESLFAKHSQWGHWNRCKKCLCKIAWENKKKQKETDPCKYYADATWKTLNQRCVNGLYANSPAIQNSPQMISYHKKQILLQVTQDELKQFWKDNEKLVKEILAVGGTPTIDRIDDNGHYTIDNMQILERKANIQKSRGIAENSACVDKETKRKENAEIYRKSQQKKEQ